MHIEIYKIKGRKYKYEVTNYREGDKVKHKKKYLGPVNPVNKSQRKKGGRTASVFVRYISEIEKQQLIQKQTDPKAFVRDRAKILLLSSEGKTAMQIATQMKKNYAKLLKIITDFNKKGFEIFMIKKSSGRRKRITLEQEKDIIEAVLKSPKDQGLAYNNWNCRILALWFRQKYNQKISAEWVRTILRRKKITFTVPKHRLAKADTSLQEAFKKS